MGQLQKNRLEARVLLILVCLGIFCTCFWYMNQTYDPLARYPYVTEENRDILLQYLNSEEIDYIISNQIKPEEFIEFIDEEGFNIRYCRLYTIAKETQAQSNAYIVNFVNRFRSNFSMSTLKTLLEHYTYVDLTTFYENEGLSQQPLKLVSDPSIPSLTLDLRTSVYKYAPDDLVQEQGVLLRSEAMKAYKQMLGAYRSMLGQEKDLGLIKGYTSYDQIFTEYTSWSTIQKEAVDQVYLPAGQNEFQLGYTIALQGYQEWITSALSQEAVYKERQYDLLWEGLDEDTKARISWLEENAYRYGFVIRYPKDKENVTDHLYDPFVLRYVGKENARRMMENNWVMEEMEFSEELE